MTTLVPGLFIVATDSVQARTAAERDFAVDRRLRAARDAGLELEQIWSDGPDPYWAEFTLKGARAAFRTYFTATT